MSRKKNIRIRESRKRRKALEKEKLHIASQVPTRTLKPSARKEIARKHASRLYIYPGDKDPFTRSKCDYPRASLLGLPMELRQQILQEVFDTEVLKNMVAQRKKIHRRLTVVEMRARDRLKQLQERGLKMTLTPIQSDYITVLGERVRELRSVSPLTYQDMEYVKGLWQRKLKRHLELQSGSVSAATYDIPIARNAWMWRTEGRVIEGEYHVKPEKRPHRCWYCMERHWNYGPVCPMERDDPTSWWRLTKKVGGWRARVQPRPTIRGKKIVFDDD